MSMQLEELVQGISRLAGCDCCSIRRPLLEYLELACPPSCEDFHDEEDDNGEPTGCIEFMDRDEILRGALNKFLAEKESA